MNTIGGRFALWCAALAVLGGLYFGKVHGRLAVETDLLAMLPHVERDALVDEAARALSSTTGKRAFFLAGGPDEASARATADDLATALKASGAFENVTLHVSLDAGALDSLYGPHRDALLSDAQRAQLAAGPAGKLASESQRALYSPAGWLRARPFAEDPLNLYGSFLAQQIPAGGALRLSGDRLVAPSAKGPYVFVTAESKADPFSLADNARVEAAIARALDATKAAHPRADLVATGVVRHAAAASSRGQAELTLFGSISTAAIVLLMVVVFRSGRPLALTLLSLAVGTLAAITVCSIVFERLHLLTLVFGSTLTGVGVDYSLHYFSDQFREESRRAGRWDAALTLHHVGPAIGIGMLATALGYLALGLLPFPGLRQMALFSIVGVAGACGTVLAAHPFLANRTPATHTPAALGMARRLADLAFGRGGGRRARLALAIVVLIGGAGISRLSFVDDIRALQSTPAWLKEQELRMRELLGGGIDTRFFLVGGASAEEVLQHEEALRAQLDALVAQHELGGYQAVSRALPSAARQRENLSLLGRKVYSQDGEVATLFSRIGAPAKEIGQRLAAFRKDAPLLTPQEWLASPASASLRSLWLEETSRRLDRGYATAVTLLGVSDVGVLKAIDLPGVQFVDRVARVSELLERFRRLASWGLAAAFLVIGVVLAVRYGPATGASLMVAPIGGALLTLATLGWLGVAANLFNVLALLLVLGMGVDYAVFMREGRSARTTVIMAILLAGLMTLLSFGLLTLSTTPFVRALGLTVALGVTYTFVLALAVTRSEDARPPENPIQ